jgi:uncharacterized integral membrane protein
MGGFIIITCVNAAHRAEEGDYMNIKLIFVLVFAGLAVLFIVQNVTVVEVKFLFWSVEVSRSLLMFLLLAVGIVIGWFLHGHFKYRKDLQV